MRWACPVRDVVVEPIPYFLRGGHIVEEKCCISDVVGSEAHIDICGRTWDTVFFLSVSKSIALSEAASVSYYNVVFVRSRPFLV